MKVAYISTYPPRKCGIGTFNNNLVHAVSANLKDTSVEEEAIVVALDENITEREYPKEVKHVIRSNHQKDYIQAARFINFSGADVCVLQHEFGILGGDQGVYILPLIKRLQIPLVVTFHTILKNPSYLQKTVIREIGATASKITVMSNLAVNFLRNIYDLPPEKIHLIEHGVPDFDGSAGNKLKEKYGFEDRKIILTFGLLVRNKGIETALHALPKVIEKHPEVLYIILGKTHPEVIRISGEEYRQYLKMLVKKYKLQDHVFFYDQFVSETELVEYLTISDLYFTPYLTREQITSGTLSYAIGAGSCVLSTPYWHAEELLGNGRGILFGFKDHVMLSVILLDLLDHPGKLQKYRKKAFEYGKRLRWPRIGKQYLQLYRKLSKPVELPHVPKEEAIDITVMPTLILDHVYRLTDDTGIVRQARYGIPQLKGGYSINDNARALLMAVMYYNQRKERRLLDYIPRYLSYIEYMQNWDGTFRNYLSFNRNFRDQCGTEDAFGRTIWALGYLIRHKPNDSYKQTGKKIFLKSVGQFENLHSVRGIANTIIGISLFLMEFQENETITQWLITLTGRLKESFHTYATEERPWFENKMTYDNGILPLAMLLAYNVVEDEEVLRMGKKSMDFLTMVSFRDNYFTPVGSRGWLSPGTEISEYNQKSTEAMGMILLYHQAFKLFKNHRYLERLFNCYLWFLGENQLNVPLYDHESGGCYQGLTFKGVSKNEGTESTLAYIIAHLSVLEAYEEEYFQIKNP
ncbi:MAG: glycosyltransferase [Bacteroidales bacterium]|nr:glycosyltransferase [Bacteroidales bacterium]MBS3776961.1 glycosyltransferase [Bacteroidales bacterium]